MTRRVRAYADHMREINEIVRRREPPDTERRAAWRALLGGAFIAAALLVTCVLH